MLQVFKRLKESAVKAAAKAKVKDLTQASRLNQHSLLDQVLSEGFISALEEGTMTEKDVEKMLNEGVGRYVSVSEILLDQEAEQAKLSLEGKVKYSVRFDRETTELHVTEEYLVDSARARRTGVTEYTGVGSKPMMKAKIEYVISHASFGEYSALTSLPVKKATLEHMECSTTQPGKSAAALPELFQPKAFIKKVKAFVAALKKALSGKKEAEPERPLPR